MSKESILNEFQLFSLGTDGIGNWLTEESDAKIFQRLDRIAQDPLTMRYFVRYFVSDLPKSTNSSPRKLMNKAKDITHITG